MNTLQTAARLRAMARALILEAEQLEAQSAPPPQKRDYRAEFAKLKAKKERK